MTRWIRGARLQGIRWLFIGDVVVRLREVLAPLATIVTWFPFRLRKWRVKGECLECGGRFRFYMRGVHGSDGSWCCMGCHDAWWKKREGRA